MIVTESRPLTEDGGWWSGSRPGTYRRHITDAQMGLFVTRADGVLVGADRSAGRRFRPSIRWGLLCWRWRHANAACHFVCCESFKQRAENESPPELERWRPPNWKCQPGQCQRAQCVFDITRRG